MRNRRASSLVELLVLMSACSVILTLSAALLHRAMHIQSGARSYLDAERSATRLSQQFRRDVHRALAHRAGGTEIGENALLQLTHTDDEVVQYTIVDGTVSRNLMRSGTIVSREEYALPSAVNVEIHQLDGPTSLALTIAGNAAEASNRADKKSLELSSSPVSVHVEAVLGRDQRFKRVAAGREETR